MTEQSYSYLAIGNNNVVQNFKTKLKRNKNNETITFLIENINEMNWIEKIKDLEKI